MAIERIVPGTKEWDAYYANHIIRYQFAVNQLQSKSGLNILDAACGVGYGSRFLADNLQGASITAVDRSRDALVIANKQFATANIRFVEDDCHTLQAAAAFSGFDAIVSFETLEHLPQPTHFLNSCFKNLKTGGQLIVSTPNQLVSSPEELNWEYHEKEYTAAEFYGLLKESGFVNIRLFGQQFTMKGKIKNEIRADLNRIGSNPLVRLGSWIQKKIKGHQFAPMLKETIDDFEIVAFKNTEACDRLALQGPFVLIAIAEKEK